MPTPSEDNNENSKSYDSLISKEEEAKIFSMETVDFVKKYGIILTSNMI